MLVDRAARTGGPSEAVLLGAFADSPGSRSEFAAIWTKVGRQGVDSSAGDEEAFRTRLAEARQQGMERVSIPAMRHGIAEGEAAIGAATRRAPCRHCHSQKDGVIPPVTVSSAARQDTIANRNRRAFICLIIPFVGSICSPHNRPWRPRPNCNFFHELVSLCLKGA